MIKVNLQMVWPGSDGIKGLDLGNLEKTVWCMLVTLMYQVANKEVIINLTESLKKQYNIEWKASN